MIPSKTKKEKKKNSVKSALQNVGLLFLSTLLVLVGLEVGLRWREARHEHAVLETQQHARESEFAFFEFDRFLGWKNKPLAEGYFTTPDSRTYVKINSQGLRDKEYAPAKPEGVKRLLVLGDSFVWGYGVETEEIFTEQLETLWGGRVEVLNLGVSGYGTGQELLYLEREGLKHQPDAVLVVLASNDYMFDNRTGRHGQYAKPYFVVEDGALQLKNFPLPEMDEGEWGRLLEEWKPEEGKKRKKGLKGFLKHRTKSYPFLSSGFKTLKYNLLRRLRAHPKIKKWLDRSRISFKEETTDLGVTKKIFLRMKAFTEKTDIKLLVMVIPYRSALEKLPNPYISEFMDFFEANNIPAIYPYDAFHEAFKQGPKLYFEHDDHWSATGHVLTAQALSDFIDL